MLYLATKNALSSKGGY